VLVLLRCDIELGLVAIPRSSNPARIAQNIDIFDFVLTGDEIAAISALDTGESRRVDSDIQGH
jgi:2,5-diketo-D-gluconate reductase A